MIEHSFNIVIEYDLYGEDPKLFPPEDQFISGVRTELDLILNSQTGRHLAASLRFHEKNKIRLVPFPEGAGAQEWWYGESHEEHKSVVRFTPESGRSACDAEIRKKEPASLSHEILFHELVHSLRRTSGRMRYWGLKGTDLNRYGRIEEFIAILVTNIFISDVTNRYKTGLRAGWYGKEPLEAELAESYRYFALGTKAFNLIARFCDDNPGFTKMLSGVQAHYNPIAAYYKNRRKAFEIAVNGDAEGVLSPPAAYLREGRLWKRHTPFEPPARF